MSFFQKTSPLKEPPLPSRKRSCIAQQSPPLATPATQKAWAPVDSWARRVAGAAHRRRDRATQSRMRLARFPVLKP